MSVFKDGKRWRYRKTITLLDGRKTRISGTPDVDTKAAAEQAERDAIERALTDGPRIGRPLVAGELRDVTIKFRVSESEAQRLERLRKAHGCETLSDLIRLATERL